MSGYVPKELAVVLDPEYPLSYRYEAIIDHMLANPQLKQYEIAEAIGCTPAWLGQIIKSDGFKARYAQRRIQFNEETNLRLTAKLVDIADKSADRVLAELRKGDECDAGFALDAATRALRSIGFGAPVGRPAHEKPEAPKAPNDGVSAETLALARQAIEHGSVRMTRVTESVEVSTNPRAEDGRVLEGAATVPSEDAEEAHREEEEGQGV